MGLFDRKRKEAEEIEQELQTTQPNEKPPFIPKERFIMEERVKNDELPIYEVYKRLQEDWESKGYADAKAFPETTYRESRQKVIVDSLRLLIKEAILKYEDKTIEMDGYIQQAEKNGFIETLNKYKQARRVLTRHFEELSTLDQDAKRIGEKTQAILLSYAMGFARGVAAVGDDKVNSLMNNH